MLARSLLLLLPLLLLLLTRRQQSVEAMLLLLLQTLYAPKTQASCEDAESCGTIEMDYGWPNGALIMRWPLDEGGGH